MEKTAKQVIAKLLNQAEVAGKNKQDFVVDALIRKVNRIKKREKKREGGEAPEGRK